MHESSTKKSVTACKKRTAKTHKLNAVELALKELDEGESVTFKSAEDMFEKLSKKWAKLCVLSYSNRQKNQRITL